MTIRHVLIAAVLLSASSASNAQSLRLTQGKPCLPNEKTYYEANGADTFGCEPAGGPAYQFEVRANGQMVWKGLLPSDQNEVSARLPGLSEQKQPPNLASGDGKMLARRCVELDPSGNLFFFGERHLTSIITYKNGDSRVSLPETVDRGLCARAPEAGRDNPVTLSLPDARGSVTQYEVKIQKISP